MKNTTKMLRAFMLAIALIVCMCMVLVGCGEEETTGSSSSTTDQSSTGSSNAGTTNSSDAGTTESSKDDGKVEDEPCTEHKGGEATCTEQAVCTECGEAYGEANGHSWVDATCTVAKTCSVCQATEGEANGHTWVDATCTVAKTCSVCQATEGEANGHSWVDATCTAAKTCSVCQATEGEANGHTWVDATCTVAKTCSVCQATEGEANGHSWVDATCTVAKTCSVCQETEGEPNGHSVGEAGTGATCTESAVCGVCGESYGDPLGHEEKVSEVPATCNDYGTKTVTCSRCDYNKSSLIAKLNHKSVEGKCELCQAELTKLTFDDIESVVPSHSATVNNWNVLFDGDKTTNGIYGWTTSEYYPEKVGDYLTITLKNETYVNEVALWFTSNYTTVDLVLCDADGNEVTESVVYNGGDLNGGNSAVVYVRLETAVKVKTIKLVSTSSKNNKQKTSEIEIYASCTHDWIFQDYSEEDYPVCGEKGGTANYACLTCGATKQETQEAMHAYIYQMVIVEGKEPSCTVPGYAMFECNVCTERVERLIAPVHSYEITSSVPSTCTEDGSRTYTCSLCGDSYDEAVVSYGHNPKWQYDSTTATCTEAGIEYYGCWNCDATIEKEVEAYGHTWSVDESTLDLEAHTINSVCSVCQATEAKSTLGMELDPIVVTVPGEFTVNANGNWTYYTFENKEGYITFTFDTTNVNVMVKDTTGKYTSQFFWGGETTWKAEVMASGSYVIAVCTGDYSEQVIAVTTEFVEEDVPEVGEVPEKAITIEGVNTAYPSTGKVWYTFQTPMAGTVTITVDGTATVSYGTDSAAMTAYTAPFVDENGNTTYYILVESEAEVTVVVNVEAPKGSLDNPYELVVGENKIENFGEDVWYSIPVNAAGTLTFTVESADVSFMYGTSSYWMNSYTGETTYSFEVDPYYMWYPIVYVQFDSAITFNVAFEEASAEPDVDEIGEKIGSIEVETTDTYGYFDTYTYTAENAGTYTFYVPANLGFYSKPQYDAFGSAEADFMSNSSGAYVSVDLEAGEEYVFLVGALTKDTWTIDVYYLAATAE